MSRGVPSIVTSRFQQRGLVYLVGLDHTPLHYFPSPGFIRSRTDSSLDACTEKKSKRIPASQRYKVEKKVREHNRRIRKEAKKNIKGKKKKIVTIPNICPFKAEILQEAAEYKKHKEEERLKQRELWKASTEEKNDSKGLEDLVVNANFRQNLHQQFDDAPMEEVGIKLNDKSDGSVKAYYKEFKKVIEAADVILEVVDARDPMGTRCKQVEKAVLESPARKRLIIVVNKADLVPRDNLEKWLKIMRGSFPTVAFKSSTQSQAKGLGHRRMSKKKHKTAGSELQVSSCVGAELLMSLLGNYCRNNGIKTAIRVGVVGLPNVGKSSLINSLKRNRACNVGATPGVTKAMQEVQLDSKIKLLDSPGVVFASSKCQNEGSYALKNAVKVDSVDPIPAATAILQRCTKKQMMDLYCMPDYSTPEEFFALKAQRQGNFKKGGVADVNAAAKGLVYDWNSGKIRYYTIPPEDVSSEVSATIMSEMSKEFDLNNFAQMEVDMLTELPESFAQCPAEPTNSAGPVDAADLPMEQEKALFSELLPENVTVQEAILDHKHRSKSKQRRKNKQTKNGAKEELIKELSLPGNERKAKKLIKMVEKKKKKTQRRTERKINDVMGNLENFSI